MQKHSITLIGMPGVGKSAIGKTMAKQLGYTFIDTDRIIERSMKSSIHEFIEKYNESAYLLLEEQLLQFLEVTKPTIIATGGSVVYSTKVMNHFSEFSTIVYLQDDIEHIEKRIDNFENRGIIFNDTTRNLNMLFQARKSLYEKYANITFSFPSPFNKQDITDTIITILKEQSIIN